MNNWIVWLLEFALPRRYWYRKFYLWSKHWRSTRSKKLKQVGMRCEKCKGKPSPINPIRWLDVHHLTYKNMWHEKMSDLQVLCRECHKQEHGQ